MSETVADDLSPLTRSRRRLIGIVLVRRPDLPLNELHSILARLDLAVDTPTLIADLDALGYEVEDEDEDDAPAVPVLHDTDPPAQREGPSERPPMVRLIPVFVAVAVLLALAVGALIVRGVGGDAEEEAGPGPSSRPSSADPESSDEAAPDQASSLAPGDGVILPFDTDGPLPAAGPGAEWVPGRGDWAVVDGQVVVAAPGEEEVVTHFVAPGPDLEAQVALPSASPGAGVAFRVEDDANYLAWVIAPEGGRLLLVRVTDARQSVVLASPPVDLPPGVRIGVKATGAALVLLVDGESVAFTSDGESRSAPGVGLVALATEQPPVFDDLSVVFGV